MDLFDSFVKDFIWPEFNFYVIKYDLENGWEIKKSPDKCWHHLNSSFCIWAFDRTLPLRNGLENNSTKKTECLSFKVVKVILSFTWTSDYVSCHWTTWNLFVNKIVLLVFFSMFYIWYWLSLTKYVLHISFSFSYFLQFIPFIRDKE